MTKDEALKLALEALEGQCRLVSQTRHKLVGPAITAIKEALSSCQCSECKVVLHASDCAVHNEPAYPKGECNCGAQPEQEPVAMKFKIYKPIVPDPMRQGINNALLPWVYDQDRSSGFDATMWVTPVATLPPQRKPLTDEEIILIVAECAASHQHTDIHFARAIERAHGIKGLV